MGKAIQIILYVIWIGMAVWGNLYAFYILAILSVGLAGKFLVFVVIILFDIYIAWDFIETSYRVKMAEIKDAIFDAKFELAAADAEIRQRNTFSNPEDLIKIVHEHIKIAKEHLDNV